MSYNLHQISTILADSELEAQWQRHGQADDKILLIGEAVTLLQNPGKQLMTITASNSLLALKTDLDCWNVKPGSSNFSVIDDSEWVKFCEDAKQIVSW